MIYSFFFLVLPVFPVCSAALFLHNSFFIYRHWVSSFLSELFFRVFPDIYNIFYNVTFYFSVTFLLILVSFLYIYVFFPFFLLYSFPFCTALITCLLISFFSNLFIFFLLSLCAAFLVVLFLFFTWHLKWTFHLHTPVF